MFNFSPKILFINGDEYNGVLSTGVSQSLYLSITKYSSQSNRLTLYYNYITSDISGTRISWYGENDTQVNFQNNSLNVLDNAVVAQRQFNERYTTYVYIAI